MGNYQSLDASVFLHALDLITDFVLVTNYFSNDSTPIIKEITLHNDNVKYINEPLRKHLGFNSVDIQELTGKIYNVTTVGDGNYCGLAVISQANHESIHNINLKYLISIFEKKRYLLLCGWGTT